MLNAQNSSEITICLYWSIYKIFLYHCSQREVNVQNTVFQRDVFQLCSAIPLWNGFPIRTSNDRGKESTIIANPRQESSHLKTSVNFSYLIVIELFFV